MIRGERFELDLNSDDEHDVSPRAAVLPSAFVGDVLERKAEAPKPPSAPSLKNKSGFPEHKRRPVQSRFKQQKKAEDSSLVTPSSPLVALPENDGGGQSSGKAKSWEEEEKERIDQENRHRLANMSADEIEEEQRELMNNFSPAFLQRLLQRSNVETGSEEVDLSSQPDDRQHERTRPDSKSRKTVKFEDNTQPAPKEELVRPSNAPELNAETLPPEGVHFPRPPQPPSLDPSSDTFFEDLHQKYFPSLPSDPDKLEWMQSSGTIPNAYDPNAQAFNAGEIRFNFKGELLPPKTAAEIPVTEGLHHHGDAPDAAGYTIAELAHLSRSSYPAQRCIAFQTLGRILYRLSKGEFGDSGELTEQPGTAQNSFGELARGLWHEVERLQVIQILVDESEGRGVDGGRHMSAKSYATEAVWLWRKGGGRRWKAA